MTDQYIYSQPIYGQEIQYQQEINPNDPTLIQGQNYGTYEVTNYQQNNTTKTKTVSMQPAITTTTYHTYEEQQPIYYGQTQEYGQPVYIQQDQTGQAYEYQQETGTEIAGYYQQIQHPNQQQIIQEQYQQPHTIAQQQAQIAQQNRIAKQQAQIAQQNRIAQQQAQITQQNRIAHQQAKIVQQMVQPKQNIKQPQSQNIKQTPSASRNPNIKQKYQQQQYLQYQHPQYQQQYQQEQYQLPQYQQYQQEKFQHKNSSHIVRGNYESSNKPGEIYNDQENDKPIIESDFQPEIPIINSVLNQSQIPFQQEVRTTPAYNPQIQPPPSKPKVLPQQSQNSQQSYVIPRRNPNIKIKQYQYANNDSHFVISKDPGSRTVPYNPNEQPNVSNVSNIKKKMSGEQSLSHKDSAISQKSLNANIEPAGKEVQNNEQISLKVGETVNTKVLDSVEASGLQNLEKTGLDNEREVVVKSMEQNIGESKISNEEIEKENPIEEKFPDQSNVNVNQNDNFPQEENQNQFGGSEMIDVDIDDQLEILPTIDNILKGNAELLPPPKKRKYQY